MCSEGVRIDYGVEHERLPLTYPPFQYFDTQEDKAMSFWTGGPSMGPNPVNLMEWVEQQAVRLPVARGVATADHGAAPVTIAQAPTPRGLQEPSKIIDPRLGILNTKSRVYSIATLYALRQEAVRKNMELKVHPSALKENIWKSAAPNDYPRNHEKSRSRAISDESDCTQRSLASGEEIVLGRNLGRVARPPYRQPIPPPEDLPNQKKDGFKRFLKEVASPPHHRVTAGGRIVPTGTQSPAGMIQFESLESSVQNRHSRQKSSGKNMGKPEPPPTNALTLYNKANSRLEAEGRISRTDQSHLFHCQAGSSLEHNVGKMDDAGLFHTQVPLTYPITPNSMQLGPLQPAGTMAPFGGSHFLGHWSGNPMYNQVLPVSPYSYPEHALPIYGQQLPPAQNILPVVGRSPSVGQSSVDKSDHHRATSFNALPDESLTKKRNEYAVMLSDLDKHVALNLHKFTPDQIARNAGKREELVKAIDHLRVAIEASSEIAGSASAHDIQPYRLFSGKSQHVLQPYNLQLVNGQQSINSNKTGYLDHNSFLPAHAGTSSTPSASQPTSLSAAAPPFIPGSFQVGSAPRSLEGTTIESRQQGTNIESTTDCNGGIPLPATYHQMMSVVSSKNSIVGKETGRDNTNANAGDSHIDSRGRSPFAVPEVDIRDIGYVDRLGLNPARHEKLFCSTVEEFQEVIRRAREQATTYSCTPGASKDPAHDAEEDIRCAMQNEEAIVLPKPVPDHISNPRPWSWSDSAYNARARPEFAPFLPPEKGTSPQKSAGASSRWSNPLQPIMEENSIDEGSRGHTAGAAQDSSCGLHDPSYRGPHINGIEPSVGKVAGSAFANAQHAMAPIAESKGIYDEYNQGDDVWGMTKGQDWKKVGAPEVRMPYGKKVTISIRPSASSQGQKKNENTFLQGMLRFPKFCRRDGDSLTRDAEVLEQQLKFEEISAYQWSKKENIKGMAPGDRGVNARDVFEAARAAFFPKARVCIGPSYQNALGSWPPPNQHGSPFNRSGKRSAPLPGQPGRVGNELPSPRGPARGKEAVHAVFNSSPLRHVSGQNESVPSSPQRSGKFAEERRNPPENGRKTPINGPPSLHG